jgi:hypothetical protein
MVPSLDMSQVPAGPIRIGLMKTQTHEAFDRKDLPKAGSDRVFGFVVGGVLSALGIWPVLRGGEARIWVLATGGILLLGATLRPSLLHPVNRVWTVFGHLIGRIMNPIVMALMYFLVITPFALFFRLIGKDPLRLKADRGTGSYWIPRDPPGPAPDTMHHQF